MIFVVGIVRGHVASATAGSTSPYVFGQISSKTPEGWTSRRAVSAIPQSAGTVSAAAGIARSMSFVAELLKVYIELNFPVGREDIRVSQGLERLAIILCLHVSFQRLEPKTLYLLSGPSPVMTGNLTLLKSELRCKEARLPSLVPT